MEDNQDVAEDESYSDDPVANPKIDWYYKFRSFAPVAILMLVTTIYLPSTVGGKFSLNSGTNKVEFGQGLASMQVCSPSLGMNPESSFVNAIYSGTHKFSGVTVSGIPTTCNGKDLVIRAYDSSGNKLKLFNSNSSDIYVYKSRLGNFRAGLNATGSTIKVINSSSFKVTFDIPERDSIDVQFISIETAEPSIIFTCQVHYECQIGDIGPGGGTIFYERASGFNCGPYFNEIGSPTGGLCYFLEFAPKGWSGSSTDPVVKLSSGPPNTTYGPNETLGCCSINLVAATSSARIGQGYRNTMNFVSASRNEVGSQIQRANSYRGGGKADWYVPNVSELVQTCKFIRGLAWVSDVTACSALGTISASSGFANLNYGTSSLGNEYWAYGMSGTRDEGLEYRETSYTRPIRAF